MKSATPAHSTFWPTTHRGPIESLRHAPRENDGEDDWDEIAPQPDENGWDSDPFADAEEAQPEYGDFWDEEDDHDD